MHIFVLISFFLMIVNIVDLRNYGGMRAVDLDVYSFNFSNH